MKPIDSDAIANFIAQGGQVLKASPAIPATEQDVLVYLASCGLRVKYVAGTSTPYACMKRRYSANGLLKLANEYRRSQKLPPMML